MLKKALYAGNQSGRDSTSRQGFALIVIVILSTLIASVIVGVYFLQHKDRNAPGGNRFKNNINLFDGKSNAVKAGKSLSDGNCEGEGVPYKLSYTPMDASDFSIIIPYGAVIGGHVTPIDHQYFSPLDYNSEKDSYPVYAMADSKIVNIETHPTRIRLVFSISCTFFYYYDLLTSVEAQVNLKNLPIEVKAGQLIGRIGGQTLDFAVWDTTKLLSGFVVPEHYNAERWKIYTADPLDYYSDDLKQLILSRYVRTAEPVSGKIDHDIDGRLIGNWFREGSGGYNGGGFSMDYFKTHLSFAPDVYDPSHFIVSVGSLYGQVEGEDWMQHMTATNLPDPKEVDVSTGLVKYDLVRWEYFLEDGSRWDKSSLARGIKAKPSSSHFGCALVQMLEARKIKFEVFVGKSCDEVNSFTDSSIVYER